MKNRREKKINLICLRKFKKKYVIMGLEWLPVFQEGCISVVVKKHINTAWNSQLCFVAECLVWNNIQFLFF